jgi:hypothetical protein
VKQRFGPNYPIQDLAGLIYRSDIPETLSEEFELLRMMYRATRCYDLNTILTAHPQVRDKQDAVRLTMMLIAKVIDGQFTARKVRLEELQAVLGEPARPVT